MIFSIVLKLSLFYIQNGFLFNKYHVSRLEKLSKAWSSLDAKYEPGFFLKRRQILVILKEVFSKRKRLGKTQLRPFLSTLNRSRWFTHVFFIPSFKNFVSYSTLGLLKSVIKAALFTSLPCWPLVARFEIYFRT